MRYLTLAAVAAATLSPPAIAADRGPRAVIDTGTLVGRVADGVASFKGIPFAAPPVGPLRWRAPRPAVRWPGVRDAGAYAHDCMQLPFPSDAAPLGTTPSEDCLYANVWAPAGARAAARLPVLVWIHGGGFVNGGSSPPTYSGAALAGRGVVVVSFNYRLGRFGTFAYPALTRADPDGEPLANYGYMDQLAALRWVRRNVAAFGGDPARVTIMGESAGGMSVHALMTSPMAAGLFAGAVIQSGGPSTDEPTLAEAEAAGIAFADEQGIRRDQPDAPARLRALPPERIVDGLNLATMVGAPGRPRTWTGPVADGRLAVPLAPAYAVGRFAHVPVMIGATSDDIGGAGGYMAAGAGRMAGVFAAAGLPTYAYRFSYVATSARAASPAGAGHATDIPFFLDTAGVKYGAATSAADRAAADLASGYLVAFVRHGDPNGGGRPAWPATSPGKPVLQDLGADGGARTLPGPAPR